MQDELSLKKDSPAALKKDEENEQSRLLFKLTLFSTFVFVFSALLLRFLLNLQTAVLLRIYSLHFQYRLFDIRFSTVDGNQWPLERILLVFGLGYLLFTLAGIFLLTLLKRSIKISWKARFILTWITFLMTFTFPAGIIAGILFFNCFGIAFHWLFGNIIIRSLIGAGVLMIMILFRPVWVFLFLKASPSTVYFEDDAHLKGYIKNVFSKAWLWGFLILLIFNKPLFDGFWPVFILSLGFIAMPLFNRPFLYDNLYIRKSEKRALLSRSSLLYVIIILALIWVAGNFRINF